MQSCDRLALRGITAKKQQVMIVKGCSSLTQLQQISIFQDLAASQLESLIPYSYLRQYQKNEIVMQEGDRLPSYLYILSVGRLQIKKIATTGKETILRVLPAGEIFAAPAIFGNGIAPATVMAELESEVVTIQREALLTTISQQPEVALRILEVFNQRLQWLHNTVHGLISERAIVRLVRLIRYYAHQYGTQTTAKGEMLTFKLPYQQMARSVGISYEECVRLVARLKPAISYRRGGTIVVQDWQALNAIARNSPQ